MKVRCDNCGWTGDHATCPPLEDRLGQFCPRCLKLYSDGTTTLAPVGAPVKPVEQPGLL